MSYFVPLRSMSLSLPAAPAAGSPKLDDETAARFGEIDDAITHAG